MASKLQDRALLALLRVYGSSPRCLRAQKNLTVGLSRPVSRNTSSSAIGALSPLDRRRRHSCCHRTAICRRDALATLASTRTKEVAVLGGGLTGLTTAYYLAEFLPSANITVYETSTRLGGWIDTEK